LNVYPNPSSGIFEMPHQLIERNFKLTDSNGRTVLYGILPTQLDLTQFPAGIYLLDVAESQYKLLKN